MADSAFNVYIGAWLNYSNDVLTLTLRDKEASILSAALVLFVGVVANHSWNVCKFIVHQVRTTRDTGDELHQQQQVALRNSANNVHALLLMLRLAFGWGIPKRRTSKMAAFGGSIPLIVLTLLGAIGWAVAQLFLAVVWTNTGDHFLVIPNHCGLVAATSNVTTAAGQAQFDLIKGGLTGANIYQLQCYRQHNDSDADRTRCNKFPVPRLDWIGSDAECPFGNKDLCLPATNSTPFRMDSGYINSQTHLGINVEHSNSIDFRYIATCSPLVPDYKVRKNGSYFYYYGGNDDIADDYNDTRVTWVYNNTKGTNDNSYNIWPFSYVVDKEFRNLIRNWGPNNSMIPSDKSAFTMSIFFISAGDMFHVSHSDDPVFGTKSKSGRKINGVEAFAPRNPMSVLGCTEEHEVCNPSESGPNRCMMMTRKPSNATVIERLKLNPSQAATILILRTELERNLFRNYVSSLNPQLIATNGLIRGTRNYLQYLALPKDHWRAEVSRWFDINLIMLQSAFVDYVTGPDEPAVIPMLIPPEKDTNTTAEIREELRRTCERQIVRNVNGVRNFNLRAILWVVGPGFAIIMLGFTIDSLAGWAQGLLRKGEARRALWIKDDMLQPKRDGQVYESVLLADGSGMGTEYSGYNNGSQDQVKYPLVAAQFDGVHGGGYKSPGVVGAYSPVRER
ncbi:hypothetical protein B0T16DRAFT_461405 [Cercophora newfieldiana]|uniref:Uncharacterized protein n=1 Tax=Cercophora newfieldiana TaxID=92897 RepID=A0AA40CK30_9PEZI|nr:hypothetical protein B0T16DRAFT_461405 [Cercophora newfieldiana]